MEIEVTEKTIKWNNLSGRYALPALVFNPVVGFRKKGEALGLLRREFCHSCP